VLLTSLLIAITTLALGRIVFGIAPQPDRIALLFGVLILGILCFAALGLAITVLIRRPETSGAITNGTYLPLALVSARSPPHWCCRPGSTSS